MSDYKDTLNLPKTAFAMKANLASKEPNMLKHWEGEKLYDKIREARRGCESFILHDGPPYANGSLHCGHALNKILKDIIVKSKTLSNFDAPFIPGWDCHGLPIELNVEKKHGKAGVKLSKSEFREKCRSYAKSQLDIQREQFKRLGVLADWDNPYATMQFSYEANIIRALGEIIKQGHLEKGFKPVYWCLDCQSSLAEAEVEYQDKESPSIDVAFAIKDNQKLSSAIDHELKETALVSLVIWTTTPWTLPANQAVAVHQDLSYSLIKLSEGEQYYILASELVSNVMERYGVSSYQEVASFKGEQLERLSLAHPLFDKDVPVVLGEHVTTDAGTGCVHTAPVHGPDDYKLGLKYDLPLDNPVLGNGLYTDETPIFSGMHVKKVDELIIDTLNKQHKLVTTSKLKHSYPHCWRHKTPVIFRATPQWFIAMDKNNLRSQALSGIDETQFTPDWGRERIYGMVEGRPDWCISRQRHWGTPIPLFIHKVTGTLHPDTPSLIDKVANQVEKEGIRAWFDSDAEAFIGSDASDYDKISDTLDVWFDAGVSHYAVLKKREGLAFPADLYLEGSDQHRGWFNSSLMTSSAINGVPPYKRVLTHGFTVDEKGIKLSKSKGNYIAPEKIINQSGADILRLWAASSDYKGEVHLSNEILKRMGDSYRRIRNTCRFLLANLFDFKREEHLLESAQLIALDKWAIKKALEVQEEIIKAYDDYEFHVVVQKIQHFCTIDMGSFYLDVIKDRQYTTPTHSVARRSCQTAIYYILEMLVRWMAPILSFTAHEVWSEFSWVQEDSVFLTTWFKDLPKLDDVSLAEFEVLQAIRDEVNKAIEERRHQGLLGSALEAEVTLYVSGDLLEQLQKIEHELKFLLITSGATVKNITSAPSDAQQTQLNDMQLEIKKSSFEKCERCWHRVETVGSDAEHPSLCVRCIDNISGRDEVRVFA